MNDLPVLITAIGTAVATIVGALALVLRARNEGGFSVHVLRRFLDWVEGKGHPDPNRDLVDQVPPSLLADAHKAVGRKDVNDE